MTETRIDFDHNVVTTVRVDTGEVVETRAPTPLDENELFKAISERMEQEGLEQSELVGARQVVTSIQDEPCHIQPVGSCSSAPAWQPIPIDDLRERIAICVKANVSRIRDGNLEITFDTDARKATASVPVGVTEVMRF